MARNNVVTAVFPLLVDAEQAKLRLVDAGVAEDRIALSADLTADGVAAEFPGQSYTNQPGQAPGDAFPGACADSASVGACVLCVDLGADDDRGRIERILRECGARQPASDH